MKGKFITFEGSEGSGKSTHIKLIYRYLIKEGFSVVLIREPGATRISEKIRKILLDPGNKDISGVSEMLLYMVARNQLMQEVIKPELKKGKIVICDRFLDSTIAYQGFGLGINIQAIEYIGNLVTEGINPNLTILLDIPTLMGLKRIGAFKDRIEQRSLGFHRRVRKGYLALARKYPHRIKVVDAKCQDKDRIQSEIRNLILRYVI